MRRLDIWDWMTLAGSSLVSAGIAALWGAAWSCMFLGALLLSVAAVHAWRSGRVKEE